MLRILHLEDGQDDALLIERAIAGKNIPATFTVVKSQSDFVSALEKGQFDLVLADNGLPGFDGFKALKMVREKFPRMGFICVSGSADETQIRKSIEAGATDYVHKDDPMRLIAAVRQEQERVELLRMNQGMARLVAAVQELSLARDLETVMTIVRRAARELTGADGATFILRDGNLCHYADEDAIAPLWKGQRFPMEACVSGWAMLNRKAAVIEDIYTDSRIPQDAYRSTFVKSMAMVPIRTEAPIGAIGNYWAQHHPPTAQEVQLLEALANTVSVALENIAVYAELEQRVKERTRQLESSNAELAEANSELESFSRAVSHDLGAPLRSIRAFTELTLEESGPELNEDCRGYLSSVKRSAIRMRELMESLLRLSKVSRAQLRKQTVDLTRMAREVIERLVEDSPQRKVELVMAENLSVEGDSALLRVVLENLLSNAWKYTSNRDSARIELGKTMQPDGSEAFFVRDNGAGFDMAYAGELFQPFKRLHREDEFPGTGVGLTTVQRIIHRHGGRIWAEAETGKGATFYFTVPK